ncbi:hypothetical protein ACWDYH_12825 [Nocardia goodfellowii]
MAQKFAIPVNDAIARLTATQAVPRDELTVAARVAPKLADAGAKLQAINIISASDRAYLAERGPEVQQAKHDSPGQWGRCWWICLIAQVLFIPFVFVMSGHWSPRRAVAAAAAHDEVVRRELAELPK